MKREPKPRPRYGQWLREQRQAHGWGVPEMRRRLRAAARQASDKLPDNDTLTVMIYRWENDRSGMSERYRLYYCRVLGIPFAAFGKAPPPQCQPPPDRPPGMLLTLADEALSALTELRAALGEGQRP